MNNSLVKAERLSFEIGMSTIAFQEFVIESYPINLE